MKLAFCLFKYFPFGGLQRDFLRIALECVRRGHQVDVFTMQWQGEHVPGVSVHCISVTAWQNHRRARQFVHSIQSQLASYDLVVGFNKMPGLDVYYAADVCYQARVRQQRSIWYRWTSRYRHWLAYEEAVFAKESRTQILLLSQRQQAEFSHFYHTPLNRFLLLPPCIAQDRMAPTNGEEIRDRVRSQLKIAKDEFLLLFVGSGFKTKGLGRVLLAYAALPEELRKRAFVYVMGNDNAKMFQRQAQGLGIAEKITFLGGRHDATDFFLAADVLLHPAYHENTGTVLLEALATGLLVLTTDVCGYAHYVCEAKAGIVLASPFQQQALNEALVTLLLLPPEERAVWKKNALSFVSQMDICHAATLKAVDYIDSLKRCICLIVLREELKSCLSDKTAAFKQMMALKGEVFRALEGRRTQRIILGGQTYFIKQHYGVGWKEIFKNIFQLRMPVLSTKNEWRAIQRLQSLGISVPDVVGYGCSGINPAKLKSFVITRELLDTKSLEELGQEWRQHSPVFSDKLKLIKEVARIARVMHEHGVNHRDFYLCHFLLDMSMPMASNLRLYLIDLHRAGLHCMLATRWKIKDLAGLYFSSKDIGLTQRDLFRFMKEYCCQSLGDILKNKSSFFKKVKQRGDALYRKQNG